MTDLQNVLGLLAVLAERNAKSQQRVADLQNEILELLSVPGDGPVEIVLDAHGAITDVRIDPEARKHLDGEALVKELNFGLIRAQSGSPSGLMSAQELPASLSGQLEEQERSAREQADIEKRSVELDAREAVRLSNERGTVTLTAVWGKVTGIECDANWIGLAPDQTITEQIVALSGRLAEQTRDGGHNDRQP